MNGIRIGAVLVVLVSLAIAQDPGTAKGRDLLTVARSSRSLGMFVMALQESGLATMLRKESPLTVFAVSDKAFVHLSREDRDVLLKNPVAMHVLMAHYLVRGNIPAGNAERMSQAITVLGVKLRADVRDDGPRVNNAKVIQSGIQCTNGVIYVLDDFDLGLVHEAVSMARMNPRAK